MTKGKKKEPKDTWWWNEEVQKAIKEKKECYKTWYQDRSTSNMEKYKEAKKNAKRAVSGARGKAYDELYEKLGTREGVVGMTLRVPTIGTPGAAQREAHSTIYQIGGCKAY